MNKVPTTLMEVTSIRLETKLKDKLKTLSGKIGYQALIRDILWQYVSTETGESPFEDFAEKDLVNRTLSVAMRNLTCVATGKAINKEDEYWSCLTTTKAIIPICLEHFE